MATPIALAVIPARGGSKGIPRKNLMPIGGKPLLVWTIEAALNCPYVAHTVVSSEDDEILELARAHGAEPLKRPSELATDSANVKPVLQHALLEYKKSHPSMPRYVTFLQPTSPLRSAAHLTRAFEALMKDPRADALVSVYEIDNVVLKSSVLTKDGFLEHIAGAKFANMNRQLLPKLYMPNGAIYIMDAKSCVENPRFDGERTLPFVMSAEESIDLDTEKDVASIEAQLARR